MQARATSADHENPVLNWGSAPIHHRVTEYTEGARSHAKRIGRLLVKNLAKSAIFGVPPRGGGQGPRDGSQPMRAAAAIRRRRAQVSGVGLARLVVARTPAVVVLVAPRRKRLSGASREAPIAGRWRVVREAYVVGLDDDRPPPPRPRPRRVLAHPRRWPTRHRRHPTRSYEHNLAQYTSSKLCYGPKRIAWSEETGRRVSAPTAPLTQWSDSQPRRPIRKTTLGYGGRAGLFEAWALCATSVSEALCERQRTVVEMGR